METMVLLVFLAIVWAAVGIYWLRTRVPTVNLSVGNYARRLGALDGTHSARRPAAVVSLRNAGTHANGVTHLRPRTQAGLPGHSLTEPARTAQAGTDQRRGVSSERARLRRRNVLVALLAMAGITLVGVVAIGGTMSILAHLIADALLLGFVMMLVQYQREIELDRTRNLTVYAPPPARLTATGTEGRY